MISSPIASPPSSFYDCLKEILPKKSIFSGVVLSAVAGAVIFHLYKRQHRRIEEPKPIKSKNEIYEREMGMSCQGYEGDYRIGEGFSDFESQG